MPHEFKHLNGKVAIYRNENPDAFTDPWNNLPDVFFHSDLDYLKIAEQHRIQVTLPARSTGSSPWWAGGNDNTQWYYGSYPLVTANNPFLFAIGRLGKTSLTGTTFVYKSGETFRSIQVVWDGLNISLYEMNLLKGSIPAQTVEIDVYLLDVSAPIEGEPAFKISGNVMTAGYGKFNSSYNYLRRANTETEDFFLYYNEKSIDVHYAGMRFIDGDGQVSDFNGYSGSWTVPVRYGVLVG